METTMKQPLWDRARVDKLKETAYVSTYKGRKFVVLAWFAGPADGAQAARELVPGAQFSHLATKCPVYKEPRKT